jgi:hypothetical protein
MHTVSFPLSAAASVWQPVLVLSAVFCFLIHFNYFEENEGAL